MNDKIPVKYYIVKSYFLYEYVNIKINRRLINNSLVFLVLQIVIIKDTDFFLCSE